MKYFYAQNVRKAAEITIKQSESHTLTLRLINGIHGGLMAERQYRTPRGLIRNSGRKVICRVLPGRLMFEATF